MNSFLLVILFVLGIFSVIMYGSYTKKNDKIILRDVAK